MRAGQETFCARAFSLIELLCVIAIIAVLAALLLPAVSRAKIQATRLQCVNNLHEAGVGFQSFAHDHNGQFPMTVPISAGGSLEFVQNASLITGQFYFGYRHFQALSNELVTPKIVVCPADTRQAGTNFATLRNENVSYFVGVNAEPGQSTSILAGDRNITNDFAGAVSSIQFGPNSGLRWTRELHMFKGNLLFADGHVEEKNTPELTPVRNQVPPVATLVMPTETPPGGGPATGTRVDAGSLVPPSVLGLTPAASPGQPGQNGGAGPGTAPATPGAVSSSAKPLIAYGGAGGVSAGESSSEQKQPPPPTNGATTGPTKAPSAEDETPTFFSQWLASLAEGLVRKGIWWLYALLLLLAAATIVARRMASGKKQKPDKNPPPE